MYENYRKSSTFNNNKNDKLKIYFGGALKGDKGGPLVKVKRLKTFLKRINIILILFICYPMQIIFLMSHLIKYSQEISQLSLIRMAYIHLIGLVVIGEKNKIMSHSYLNSDYVFWQSNFVGKMADKYLGVRNKPGEVLFNAVDTKDYFSQKTRLLISILLF